MKRNIALGVMMLPPPKQSPIQHKRGYVALGPEVYTASTDQDLTKTSVIWFHQKLASVDFLSQLMIRSVHSSYSNIFCYICRYFSFWVVYLGGLSIDGMEIDGCYSTVACKVLRQYQILTIDTKPLVSYSVIMLSSA